MDHCLTPTKQPDAMKCVDSFNKITGFSIVYFSKKGKNPHDVADRLRQEFRSLLPVFHTEIHLEPICHCQKYKEENDATLLCYTQEKLAPWRCAVAIS